MAQSIWAKILGENRHDRKLISTVLQDKPARIYESDFKRFKGQWTWGDTSYNIRDSKYKCKHACKYCYIWPMFARWNRVLKPVLAKDGKEDIKDIEDFADFADFPLDAKKVNKRWMTARNPKMYFFPSSHDIFPENMLDYLDVCHKMIKAGHEIMFVTKPHMAGIRLLCDNVDEKYKDKLNIFLTITSNNDGILRELEPYSANYAERLKCLKLLYREGFNVNVMMEPYLSDPTEFIGDLLPYTRDVIAIGPMNYSKGQDISANTMERLNVLYSGENINKLYLTLGKIDGNNKIFFKKELNMRLLRFNGIAVSRKR